MGDIRFERPYRTIAEAEDRAAAIRLLSDMDVVAALAAAATAKDPYLANVLASEAQNRVRTKGTIVETAEEGMLSIDAEGRITYVNPAVERLLGWQAADLLGEDVHDALHSQDAEGRPIPREACRMIRALRTGEPLRGWEDVFSRPDGTLVPVAVTAAPILREGEVEGLVYTFFDIRDRLAAEAVRRHLAAIVENSEDAIITFTPEGILLSWNRGAEHVYGSSAEEMIGRSLFTLAPPGMEEEHRRRLHPALAGEPVTGLELVRRRKDGRLIDVAITISPLRDASGRVVALSGISRDVSRRKAATRALRESEALKAAILTASLDAIVTIDGESRVVEWNQAAERLLGYSREEALGKDFVDLILHPRFRGGEHHAIARYLRTGEGPGLGHRLEVPVLRKDGTEFAAEVSLLPLCTEGRLLFTGFLRDVTARRRREDRDQSLLEVTGLLSSSLDYTTTLQKAAELMVPRLAEWCVVDVLREDGRLDRVAVAAATEADRETLQRLHERYPPDPAAAEGLPKVLRTRQPILQPEVPPGWIGGFARDEDHAQLLRGLGVKSVLMAPLLLGDRVLGVLTLARARGAGYDEEDLSFALALADRVALAVENTRLYKALEESERRYRTLYDYSPAIYFTLDGSGTIVSINRYGARYLGYGPEELVGTCAWDLHEGPDSVTNRARLERFIREGAPGDVLEVFGRRARKDGTRIDVREICALAEGPGGERIVLVTCTDVTEQLRAEEAQRRLAALVQATDDAILNETPEGIIMSWNPAAERLFGWTASEMVGSSVRRLFPTERLFEIETIHRRVARGERIEPYETERARKDGSRVPVLLTLSPVLDREGRVESLSATFGDLRGWKRAEARRLAAEEARREQGAERD